MRHPTIEDFGRQLLETEDLDPVYVMLEALSLEQRKRWCAAYWLYYSSGVASAAVDGDFWEVVRQHLPGPRGTERRHFRGTLAERSVALLESAYPDPVVFVNNIVQVEPRTFARLSKGIQQHYGFGQWIAFKATDMVERCLHYRVNVADCLETWHRDPLLGAEMACTEWGVQPKDTAVYAWQRLLRVLGKYKAPPLYDRLVNAQEVETVLCKWKSQRHGHYYIGKDTVDVYESLRQFQHTGPTARKLLDRLEPLKRRYTLL